VIHWIIPAEKFVVVLRKDNGKDAEVMSGVWREAQRLMELDVTTDTA